jgi:RNA dependent RNA polymerase
MACRGNMPSTVSLDEMTDQKCCDGSLCDNCCQRKLSIDEPMNHHIVTALVKKYIEIESSKPENPITDSFYQAAHILFNKYVGYDKLLMSGLLHCAKDRNRSLLDYMVRVFGKNVKDWRHLLEPAAGYDATVSFFLRSETMSGIKCRLRKQKCSSIAPRIGTAKPPKQIFDEETFQPITRQFPYLIQFELCRLEMSGSLDTEFDNILQRKCLSGERSAWRWLLEKKQKRVTALHHSPDSGSLFYICTLLEDGKRLTLNPPSHIFSRRIYRRFPSDRFLVITVKATTRLQEVQKVLSGALPFCGRTFRFFWAKPSKSPQSYIMFAESGIGIRKDEECNVDTLRNCASHKMTIRI